MQRQRIPRMTAILCALGLTGFLAGCTSDDTKLENKNPGPNSKSVVVAFGDSITMGNRCPCPPYPSQLGPIIAKTIVNTGIGGSKAQDNIGRTQQVIDAYRPAYMLILYGVNDLIASRGVAGTVAAVEEMIKICRQNNVAPAVATYPVPVKSYRLYAFNIIALNKGLRRLAKSEGIPLIDLEREFALPGYPNSSGDVQSDPTLFTPEGLHPNDVGTRIMARVFADIF